MPFSPLSRLSILLQVPVLRLYPVPTHRLSPCALRPPVSSKPPYRNKASTIIQRGSLILQSKGARESRHTVGAQSALGCKQKATIMVLAQCLQDTEQATASSIQALGDEAAENVPSCLRPCFQMGCYF